MRNETELLERRAFLLGEIDRVLALKRPTEEQIEVCESGHQEIRNIDHQLFMSESTGTVVGLDGLGASHAGDGDTRGGRTPGRCGLGGVESRSYSSMFPETHSNADFQNFGEYLDVLNSGRFDPRLNELRAMSEGSESGGGFLVPSQFSSTVFDTSLESEVVRPLATVFPMTSKTRQIPAWDSSDHQTSLFGGFVAAWEKEAGSLTDKNPKPRLMTMTAHKLYGLVRLSNELAADGIAIDSQLSKVMSDGLSWYLDQAFLFGSGVGEPLGIANSPAMIEVDPEENQTTGIVYPNLAKMFAKLLPASFSRSIWIANPTVLPSLLTLGVTIGVAGEVYHVINESSGKFSIFGRPVVFNEKLPSLNSRGDIMLCDLSLYGIGLRQDLQLEKSTHALFMTDESVWRIICRADGFALLDKPITLASGDTASGFVCLGERP
ncbi:MAG: phage major capsid protein [Candidatus Sumerlaeota bacterium]|nr:phage major capsid protein [Candidatus Sumerlaeota bacterium]